MVAASLVTHNSTVCSTLECSLVLMIGMYSMIPVKMKPLLLKYSDIACRLRQTNEIYTAKLYVARIYMNHVRRLTLYDS